MILRQFYVNKPTTPYLEVFSKAFDPLKFSSGNLFYMKVLGEFKGHLIKLLAKAVRIFMF